ncbi:hypothetical protein [Amycolatopsis silviterrae]|uniref:Uncharacterized protein n=1 Tax=Amycolatopsis silviterrae TaxID=1656914 RepID=A0ABW5H8G9_9PSEU
MSRRSVQVLVAFGVLAVGVFLVSWQVSALGAGAACVPGRDQPGSCGPAYANPAEWGVVLVHGAVLALIYLRYLADRKPVH